ncbi:MAG: multicopper oxidase family protein, partial [Pseudomonadota bacterium]
MSDGFLEKIEVDMPKRVTRRAALGLAGGATLAAALPITHRSLAATPQTEIDIGSARFSFFEGTSTRGLVSTRPDGPPPVIRLRRNQRFIASVTNTLEDYTTMHWHGLRLDNAMDGVPYLTQFPLGQNDWYDYALVSPDAGTFWYHPHCMTMDQMALGLTGILIVDEDEDPGFDDEVPLNLRDFRLRGDGAWLDLWTARGAARGGTFGTVMTTNWLKEPIYEATAGGLARLRVAATDTTRIYKLFMPEADAKIIALDGHPLSQPVNMPRTKESAIRLGPGQRADIALLMPETEGEGVSLFTDAPGEARLLAQLMSRGASA